MYFMMTCPISKKPPGTQGHCKGDNTNQRLIG
jgi:hypothetical protein